MLTSATVTPQLFIAKWKPVTLTEMSAYQQHFLDLCELLSEEKPAAADPTGAWFTFQKGLTTTADKKGFADVWRRGCFGWEYKGKHKDLKAAYQQLLKYREALENPPLLIVCDLDRFEIHTNFPNTVKEVRAFDLNGLADPSNLAVLRKAFTDPDSLKPGVSRKQVTEEIAKRFCKVADGLRGREVDSDRAAQFLVRLVFCMFAEHSGLLTVGRDQGRVFTKTLQTAQNNPTRLTKMLAALFRAMADGGFFGSVEIRHFNGGLFNSAEVLDLTPAEIADLLDCAQFDWSGIEPSISGTLFERIIDPRKRAQLGAHYTSTEDIETLLNPVFLDPLRREWDAVRAEADALWEKYQPLAREASHATAKKEDRKLKERSKKAWERFEACLRSFFDRLATVTVLDPACGSGNFLYVALRMLLDLHKTVWQYAAARGMTRLPFVTPEQFHGLEKNEYARELAQTMLWIGYIQWECENPIHDLKIPLLGVMDNVTTTDAILDLSDPDRPHEPQWPDAEFIVGNPPFLGGNKIREVLGDKYVEQLFKCYDSRVPAFADLCCYWFEKSRAMIQTGQTKRVGLLATQGIRGGANREVLRRIKRSGDIYFAVSDRDWVQDGAMVHISMVGFDSGEDGARNLNGRCVPAIHANLSSGADVTGATVLPSNRNICFMGASKKAPFNVADAAAREMLHSPNPNGRASSDVIRPWANGLEVTRRPQRYWIIDFGNDTPEEDAAFYERPFEYVTKHVRPVRIGRREKTLTTSWWRFGRPRVEMRLALGNLPRYLVTPAVAKHRTFAWLDGVFVPDQQLLVFAVSDEYHLGVLHSRVHEVWTRVQGTQVRERESGFRYTPTTCFETFPFPEPFTAHQAAISEAAKRLDTLRNNWLNPPEWTKTEVLEFLGSADGPWKRYITEVDTRTGIGLVRYPRTVPKNAKCATELKCRTLTNLYNHPPAWLKNAHKKLDELVLAAYGWSPNLADDDLLARLLELNLERSEAEQSMQAKSSLVTAPKASNLRTR